MEESKSRTIRDQFYNLISHTKITKEFLLKFKEHNVFTLMDIDTILRASKDDDSLDQEQAFQFYSRLLRSSVPNTFELLLAAVKETEQHLAYELLTKSDCVYRYPEVFLRHMTKRGLRFHTPPTAVGDFVVTKTHKVLLLETLNVPLTLERLFDTVARVKLVKLEGFEGQNMDSLGVIIFNEENMTLMEITEKLVKCRGMYAVLCEKDRIPPDFDCGSGGVLIAKNTIKWDDLTNTLQAKILKQLSSATTLDFGLKRPLDFIEDEQLIKLISDSDLGAIREKNSLAQIVETYINLKIGDLSPNLIHDLGMIAKKQCHGWTKDGKLQYKDEATLRALVKRGFLKVSSDGNRGGFEYQFHSEYVANYFVGKILSRMIRIGATEAVQSELMKNTFDMKRTDVAVNEKSDILEIYEFKNKLTAYYVDCFFQLNESSIPLLLQKHFSDIFEVANACINGGFMNIFMEMVFTITDYFAMAAVFKGSQETIRAVLNEYQRKRDDIVKMKHLGVGGHLKYTLLHIAIRRGDPEVCQLLLNNYGFISEILRPHMRNLIHTCVENTMKNCHLKNRKRIIKMFLGLDPDLLDAQFGPDQKTPLLSPKVNTELLLFLIELGADTTAVTKKEEASFLVTALEGRTPEEFHDLVKALLTSGHADVFKELDSHGRTQVHNLQLLMSWKEETLGLFRKYGVVMKNDKKGNNLLYYAISAGKPMDYIKMLIRWGFRCGDINKNRDTILHHAAHFGHVEAIQHFCRLMFIDRLNKQGMTPLHVALRWGHQNVHEIVEILLKAEADPNVESTDMRTPLYYARLGENKEKIELRTIELMKEHGAKSHRFRVKFHDLFLI